MKYLFLFLHFNCLWGQVPQEKALVAFFDTCYSRNCLYYKRFPTYKMLSKKSQESFELKEECINIWYYDLDSNRYAGAVFRNSYEEEDNYLFIFDASKEKFITIYSNLHLPTFEKILYNPLNGSWIHQMLQHPAIISFYEKGLKRYCFVLRTHYNQYKLDSYFYEKNMYNMSSIWGELSPFKPLTTEIGFEFYLDLAEKVHHIPTDSVPRIEWRKVRSSCR